MKTQRLKLIPLSNNMLELCHQSRDLMEKEMGLERSFMDIDPEYEKEVNEAMINFWLPKTSEHPDKYQWYTSWEIVNTVSNTSIGGIGFAGYPNENGETEVGFMIDRTHHRQGYALEALIAMLNWAMNEPDTRSVIAHTPPDNFASQNLLLKAGFERTGLADGLLQFRFKRKPLVA